MIDPLSLALSCAAVAVATPCLARLARRTGWLDAPQPGTRHRKLQTRPVPPVGGAALLAAGLLGEALARAGGTGLAPGGALGIPPALAWGTLLLAFALGLADDLRRGGLPASVKGSLQLAVLVPLALHLGRAAGGGAPGALATGLGVLFAGCLALNAANTFDNADGALSGTALVGLAGPAPTAAAMLLGFLPWNLPRRAGRPPCAYLGDGGSHLIGAFVLLTPAAWPALWIPALDLARLAVVRLRSGSRPWIGDRRHLAHRLARRGLGPLSVALVLAAAGAPAALGATGGVLATTIGALASLAAFLAVLRWAPAAERPPARPGRSALRELG